MQIDIRTIQMALASIFNHLQERGIESIEISEDFYWNISIIQRYDPYTIPTQFDLGQLTNDYEEIIKIVNGNNEPLGFALVWLSSLIRIIGEKKVS